MNRSLELASALGGIAVVGAGVAPFLHREAAPDTWFELQWPRDVDVDDVLSLLRHLASTRRPSVTTFEVRADHGRITHLVGAAKAETERLRHLFTTYLPAVLLEGVERAPVALARAVEVRLGTRERALRTDAPADVARSVVGALAGTAGTTIMQWQLGARLAPSHVSKDSVGLPTTGRALSQAFRYGLAPLESEDRRKLQAKVGDHGFRTSLRVATSIKEPKVAEGQLRAVVGGLRVAEAPGVPLKIRRTDPSAVVAATSPRRFPLALNVTELVGLLGWPIGDTSYSGVTRIGSRRLPVPAAVPSTGRIIGEGNHPQTRRPIAQSPADSTMGTLLIGPTGVGKSTAMAALANSDVAAGRGLVLVDPKGGDLVDEVLSRMPPDRIDDVVVLDPSDAAPIGINPLQDRSPELAADAVVSLLSGIYPDGLGPRSSDILFAGVSALAAYPGGTLAALPVLLSNERYRREVTARASGEQKAFWRWFEQLQDAERANVIAPLSNKLRPLLRPSLRAVLAQAEPKFRITDVFDKQLVLLVALDQAKLGSIGVALLSSIIVAEVWRAVQARGAQKSAARSFAGVYVDEWQLAVHGITDFADVLARSRSYGVGWCLANQHLAQLTPGVRAALANARSKIAFRLSAEDAANMARTTDQLDAADFQRLGKYEVYASLVANGETQPFCSATTLPLPPATTDTDAVRAHSRASYGVERELTEEAIRRLWEDDGEQTQTPLGSRRRRSARHKDDREEP